MSFHLLIFVYYTCEHMFKLVHIEQSWEEDELVRDYDQGCTPDIHKRIHSQGVELQFAKVFVESDQTNNVGIEHKVYHTRQ